MALQQYMVACRAYTREVAGSNPSPDTMKTRLLAGFLFIDIEDW